MTESANTTEVLTTRRMIRSLVLLLFAQVAVLSLWFSAASILPALAAANDLNVAALAGLSAATQVGFVAGALALAVSGLPDRVRPQRLFAVFAVVAASANLTLFIFPPEGLVALISRGVVGFALAGVYPVGLKIAVGWSVKRRGLIASLLVGALTLGSASPHLAVYLGGVDWQLTLMVTSSAGVLGAVAILFCDVGPYHQRAAQFDPRAIMAAWHNKPVRYAFFGYFGHMWELYAFWAWVGVAAGVAAKGRTEDPTLYGSIVAFLAIGLGAVACIPAGFMADRYGKARVARIAMILSAVCGVLAAVTFGGSLMWFTIVLVMWGISIIPDSAQFSALVADHAPPARVGSLMTLQTAFGFALTVITVQFLPKFVEITSWPVAFLVLALGPALGIYAMRFFKQKN